MKPDELISDSVEVLKNNYHKKMLDTKKLFFKSLQENKPIEDFLKEFNKTWKDLDYRFMNSQKKELELLIDEINKVSPKSEAKQFLELVDQSKFEEKFNQYESNIKKYYENRLKTIDKGIDDVDSYLTNFVDKYDNVQKSIPYFTKEGLLHSYHDIADYSSMLFNTNLLRTATNRTLYDAEYLNMDLVYIPAHNLSCPKCMEWQGRIYSISGKDKRYPNLDEAYSNGLGHPNCKHIAVIFWGNSQIQEDNFNSDYWEEEYRKDQKRKALQKEIKNKNADLKIYRELNNQTKIETTKNQLKRLRIRLSEI